MAIDRSILEAKSREGSGKGPARRLRLEGMIPAVVYGRHLDKPAHIAVVAKAIRTAVTTPHKLNTLITLRVAGGDRLVMLKDVQMDPVSRDFLHADFIEVRENEQVKVKIPVVLVGKAIGTADGGILSQIRREIEVLALPNSIPERIEVDVTHLKIAEALHINDVKMPEGVTVKTHVNFTVAVVAVPDKEEVVVAPVASVAATPAAGADGKPAPGAAPGATPAAGAKVETPKKDDKKK